MLHWSMISPQIPGLLVIDDLFTPQECQEIIDYFARNADKIDRVTDHRLYERLWMVDKSDNNPTGAFAARTIARIYNLIEETVHPQRAQLDCRHPGAMMNFHIDQVYSATAFTSVTYLNDDFEGGELVVRPYGEESDGYDMVVKPRPGRTVFYNGGRLKHKVNEVVGGFRYSIPVWYKDLPPDTPDDYKWWKNML